jgi:hypothetical protein
VVGRRRKRSGQYSCKSGIIVIVIKGGRMILGSSGIPSHLTHFKHLALICFD